MTVKNLFITTAILNALLGLSWLFFPTFWLAAWGTTNPSDILIFISRRYAVLFLGYAVTLWLCRNSPPSYERRALMAGAFLVAVLIAGTSLSGVVTGTINALGLLALAVESLLAFGFGYFLFVKTGAATEKKAEKVI